VKKRGCRSSHHNKKLQGHKIQTYKLISTLVARFGEAVAKKPGHGGRLFVLEKKNQPRGKIRRKKPLNGNLCGTSRVVRGGENPEYGPHRLREKEMHTKHEVYKTKQH